MKPSTQSIAKYLAIETAGGPSWYPSGDRIAFVYNAPGLYHIYTVPIFKNQTLWPSRLTYEEDRCTNPIYLSDGTLIFTRDYGGNENFQIGAIDQNGILSWISKDPQAKHLTQTAGKRGYFFTANIEDKSSLDVYRHLIPLEDNEPELLHKPDSGIMYVRAVSDNDKNIILRRFRSNNDQELLNLEIDSGTVTSLTGSLETNRTTRWYAIRWIDEHYLLVATDHESDFMRVAILTLSGDLQTIDEIEDLKNEYDQAAYDQESPDTYIVNRADGYSILYRGRFRSDGLESWDKIDFPYRGVIPWADWRSFRSGLSVSPGGKYLAITLSSPNNPMNIWIIDMKSFESWKATEVNTAGLNFKTFADASLHRLKSFDGLSVPYFRYLPKKEKPQQGWPAILVIHGGPEWQTQAEFAPRLQFFLSAGFAVIAPNIRGSTGYGRSYMDLDNIEKRLDSIMDIKSLALHLKESDNDIDGKRLVVFGGSYGGFAVLSAMTEHPDLWKAGVDIVGISNFVTFLENTASWRRPLRESEYGSLEKNREILEKISPIRKVDKISAPLFIIQGDNDERVPLSESIQIFEKLQEKGLPVRLLRFADEGHGLAKLKNRIEAYSQVLSWLQEIV